MLPEPQQAVYDRVVRGQSDVEIGRALHISVWTVRDRLELIVIALGLSGRPRPAILAHFFASLPRSA